MMAPLINLPSFASLWVLSVFLSSAMRLDIAASQPLCGAFPENYPVDFLGSEVHPVYEEMLLPQPTGWLGSDVAHSIPLSATRNLWLFADTLIGTITNAARDGGAAFVNSSVGIQDRTIAPPGNVTFHWGPGNTSFFPHQPGTQGDFYWPTQGILLNGELFVFCYNVKLTGGPGFGFTTPSTTLIRIPNPQDSPENWIQNAADLGIGDDHRGFHSAVFLKEPYVYLMGFDDGPNHNAFERRSVLARILAADLIAGATSEAFEFLVEGPSGPVWGNHPDNLASLFQPGVTETNIQFDAQSGLYLCTTYRVFSSEILLTVAPDPAGPWSEPVCVYEIPEFDLGIPNVIAYAARPHPELSTRPGEMVVTYATNIFGSIAPLFTPEGLAIYYPRFARIRLHTRSTAVANWFLY